MQWRNQTNRYGAVTIMLHWTMALIIFAMFVLGLYMVDLTYQDPWYHLAPEIHQGLGVLLVLLLVGRAFWRFTNIIPVPTASPWEQRLAHGTHLAFYVLILILALFGYLAGTAEGDSLSIFGWFDIPAAFAGFKHQEDIAGGIHQVLAWSLIALASVHALAALKHHFIDRDLTLVRMFGRAARAKSKRHKKPFSS